MSTPFNTDKGGLAPPITMYVSKMLSSFNTSILYVIKDSIIVLKT